MKFQTKKILIAMIVCNLLAGVGYFFLYNLIKQETQDAAALMSSIDSGEQKNSKLKNLRSVIKDTQDQRDRLTSLFLSSDSEVAFIEQIETLATSSSLTVKTNNVSSVAGQTPTTKTFQMQEEVNGSWNNVMYFLSQLENLPYDIHVQNLSLSQQGAVAAPVVMVKGKKVASKTQIVSWHGVFDVSVTENK